MKSSKPRRRELDPPRVLESRGVKVRQGKLSVGRSIVKFMDAQLRPAPLTRLACDPRPVDFHLFGERRGRLNDKRNQIINPKKEREARPAIRLSEQRSPYRFRANDKERRLCSCKARRHSGGASAPDS